jgi:hypothetical protein
MRTGLVDVLGWGFIAIVGFAAGLMIAFAGLVGWLFWIKPVADLPPLEVVVDRSLDADGAWPVGKTDLPEHSTGAAWVEVECRRTSEWSIDVLVEKRWGPYGDDLGFRIDFRTSGAPRIVATGSLGGLRFGQDWPEDTLGGTIRVNSILPPSNDETLILTFDLITNIGSDHRLAPGKLVLRADDLR